MTTAPDMIVFIESGVLEFSARGHILIRVKGLGNRAKAIFDKVRAADTAEERSWLIQAAYKQFAGGENV